jgi:type IV pilus assembly protein PilY1
MRQGMRGEQRHALAYRRGTPWRVAPSRAVAWAAIVTAALATGAPAAADDTEVFFADVAAGDVAATNVLFVLPTGRTMGCVIGSAVACEKAVEDGTSRMDVMKAALVKTLDRLADEGVSVGLMRGNNNGRSDASAGGGFIGQQVAPLTRERRDELARWICPFGMDRRECHAVVPDSGDASAGQLMLAPSNHFGFCTVDRAGAPDCRDRLGPGRQALTELLFEANRYFAGRRPAWGAGSTIGPGYSFPGHDYDPRSIWGPATLAAADCREAGPACRYRSPADDCQHNVLVILSDGALADDRGNDAGVGSIANSAGDPAPYHRWFKAYRDPHGLTTGPDRHGCTINTGIDHRAVDPVTGEVSRMALSNCADDLAYSMRRGGFVAGRPRAQVFTYTVGFDVAAATRAEAIAEDAPRSLLKLLARAGGGRHYSVDCADCAPAEAADELATVLIGIVRQAMIANASFGAPTVPVNAFNRTENLDELYLAVFRPALSQRWRGNVKKYRLAPNGDILGRDDALAVNALTGRFLPDVSSFWPSDPAISDGDDILAGGAARALPDPELRRIYTNEDGASTHALDSYDVEQIGRRADAAAVLGYAAAGLEPPACPARPGGVPADGDNPAVCHLLAWVRGADVTDAEPAATEDSPAGNGNFTEPRHDLGDPLHTRPTVVTYGGDAAKPRAVVYAVTNDGALHAFDAESGRERWAFIPWDRLGRMLALYRDRAARPRTSLGLDGPLRVLTLDRNGNGRIEPLADGTGDRVILYFGMRRGGRNYYAVDVTHVDLDDPAGDAPRLLWIAGPPDEPAIAAGRQLPLTGQSWSRPVVTRLRVPGHRGTDDLVVMFAGGYDPDTQDPPDGRPQPYRDDTVGTGVYVLDAFSGQRLWRAGPDAGADLALASLTAAIPGDLAALDLTGDGYVDTAYFADLRGRVWRLDFDAAAADAAGLASGGILADLGGEGIAGARRFFTTPDVSSVIRGGRRWLNVAIGSGHREMPLSDRATDNRFYSLRDYHGARSRDWARAAPIREDDLVDVTPDAGDPGVQAPVPAGAAGWLLRLDNQPGEKAISSSRTFEHTVFFPTFLPAKRDVDAEGEDERADACAAAVGDNLLYQVSVIDARPVRRLAEAAHSADAGGLALRLAQPGIAPEPVFVFPATTDAAAGAGGDPSRPQPLCLVGVESCGSLAVVEPRRTYWRQRGAE